MVLCENNKALHSNAIACFLFSLLLVGGLAFHGVSLGIAQEFTNASPAPVNSDLLRYLQDLQMGRVQIADIKALVALGLPPKVQEALDIVRVIGNDAVHPGTIDLRDDRETVNKLFRLVNFIAQKMVTEPKEIDEIYGSLPQDKPNGISERDKT